jgi:DNA-binding NarL/FixJ family response regulator
VQEKTVRNRLTVLCEKLGAAGRLQLALLVSGAGDDLQRPS